MPITIAGGQASGAECHRVMPTSGQLGAALLRSVVDLAALGRAATDERRAVRPFGPTGTRRPGQRWSARSGVGAVADYAHQRGITMTFEVLNRMTSLVDTAAQAMASSP